MPTQKTTSRSATRARRPKTSRHSSGRTGDASMADQDGFTFVNVSFPSAPTVNPQAPDAPHAQQPLQPPAEIHSATPPGHRSGDVPQARAHPPSMFSRSGEGDGESVGDPEGECCSTERGRTTPACSEHSSSPDIGAYSLLPGDSPYVPSTQARSRVKTKKANKEQSPPRTRIRTGSTRKKTPKSRTTVVSSDEEDGTPASGPPVLRQTESLKRGRANTVTASKCPTRSKRPRESSGPGAPAHPSTDAAGFIDDEAEVEVDPDVAVSGDEASEANLDGYDSNDSFIDDSSVYERDQSGTPEDLARLPSPPVIHSSQSSARSAAPIDVSFTTDSLLQSETFVRALLSKLERERGLNLEGMSDEDQRMELARRDSLIMGMRPWLTSYSQTSPATSPLTTQQKKGRPTLRTPAPPARRQPLPQGQTSSSQKSPSSNKSSNRKKDKGKARASEQSSVTNEGLGVVAPDESDNSQFDDDTRTPSSSGGATAPAPVTPTGATAPAPTTPSANAGGGQQVIGGNILNPTSLSSRCPPLPLVCEVTNSIIQDALLAATYHSCVALLSRQFIPWSELPGPGQVNASAWADQCPSMSMNFIVRALVFERSANYVNPSRADPRITRVRELPGTSPRYNLYVDTGAPLIATTVGFLDFSQLTVPSDSGMRQRFVRIIGHTQEWERQQGFAGMAFGFPTLHTQLSRDSLQISTRALSTRRGPDGTPGGRSTAQGMFNRNSALNSPSSRVSADLFSLPADQPVPTYDARGSPNLDFDTAMPFLPTLLPPWQYGEIPYGSAVLVAYTMTVYRSNAGNWTLGCNIQFVVVLGTPASFDQ